MKTRTILLTLAALFVAVAVCFAAENAHMGTWKLNEAQSKIPAGSAKNMTVVYAMSGDSVTLTTDGVDANGKPTHTEWTGKFDGKDYPVTGSPDVDMRAFTQVNDHTLKINEKKGGKVITTVRSIVSADGKTRTVTTTSTDASGKKTTSTRVYDKQ